MKTFKKMLSASVLGVAAVAGLAQAQTNPPYTGHIGCFCVTNNTGQPANDFHVELFGLPVGHVEWSYSTTMLVSTRGPGTTFSGTIVNFSGGTVAPGTCAFFAIGNYSFPIRADHARMYWTWNGSRIGDYLPVPNQYWRPVINTGGGGGMTTGHELGNLSGVAVYVDRRTSVISGSVDPDDLVRDGAIWNNATIIDDGFVALEPGEELVSDFSWYGGDEVTLVTMYELQDASGTSIGFFADAVSVGATCQADLTGSSDPNDPMYGVGDGVLDANDFFVYLDMFIANDLARADFSHDGVLDAGDFFMYLDLFVAGCP